ncbi:MAG: hypothetical protein KAU06_04355 [Candidatus Marinimicrobia bacterium]|nr:hypothetical protein [Candidatus Neomarinimicrobiota bacterium]
MDREEFKATVQRTLVMCSKCGNPMGFSRWDDPLFGDFGGIFVCTKCGAKKKAVLRKPMFSEDHIDYIDY